MHAMSWPLALPVAGTSMASLLVHDLFGAASG
jgi:hypothetical protein